GGPELADALRAQRTMLDQKRQLLDRTITAIREAETALRTAARPNTGIFTHIIEGIEMQNTSDWKKQYDELVQGKIERRKAMTPEMRADLQRQWAEVFRDVEQVLDHDPSSADVQALANRWVALLGAFAPDGKVDAQLLKRFGAAYQSGGVQPTTVLSG